MNINFYTKKNKKSKLTTKEIAQELNIDEEKIKELERGERTLTGKTLDKYLKVVGKTDTELALENAELKKWFNETDLKKLRVEFGYNTQTGLAKAIGIDQAVLSRAENKNKTTAISTMKALYNFYQNDFNKKVEKAETTTIETVGKYTKEEQDLIDWYKNFDLKKYMAMNNILTIEMSEKSGLSPASIYRLKRKMPLGVGIINRLHTYIMNNNNNEMVIDEKFDLQDWYKNFDLEKFMKDNKIKNYELAEALELGIATIPRLKHKAPAQESTLNKLYNYVMKLTEEPKEEIREEVKEEVIHTFDDINVLSVDLCSSDEIFNTAEENIIENNSVEVKDNFNEHYEEKEPATMNTCEDEVKVLREELFKAQKQIARYELLLDMIIEKKVS